MFYNTSDQDTLYSKEKELMCIHYSPPKIPHSCVLPYVQYMKVTKLTSDAKYEDSDIKAAIAALGFIFSSAAKHSVSGEALDNELQQLGLPKGEGSHLLL